MSQKSGKRIRTLRTYSDVKLLSQEVRENRGHFIALNPRDRPRRPREFEGRISNLYS